MIYGSVCSGIEAVTVAWEPLGWTPAFFAENAKFPSAVLAERFPGVPNHGDFTTIKEGDYAAIDLLVGGTPCQSFSVAGFRGGLGDDRGNLALQFYRLLQRLRPRWFVWENVPGVLSSNGGRDFGAILGAFHEGGYGCCWRVLDAQYVRVDGLERAVPQRRRRVFVVGYLGDWRPPCAVLLEPKSVCGSSPPRREKGQGVTPILEIGARTNCDGKRDGDGIGRPGDPMFTLQARHQHGVADSFSIVAFGQYAQAEIASTLLGRDHKRGAVDLVAHALTGEGFDASEDGAGRGTPLTVFMAGQGSTAGSVVASEHVSPTLRSSEGGNRVPSLASSFSVRHLTPLECERLQGFPDNWTLVPYRGKPAKDSPRYYAIGNSMAVNVMRWIGRRIKVFEKATAKNHDRIYFNDR